MRKALLFFSIVAVNFSNAQSLQPVPYENSGWSYVGWIIGGSGFPEEEDLYRSYFDGDTNLNSMPYNKLYYDLIRYFDPPFTDTLGSHVYIGGMRNDATLYYFLDKDSTEEVLVYDLSKTNIGDSLPTGLFFGIDYLIIEDTSQQVMEDGSIRQKFNLDFQGGPGVNAPYNFYEGIGYSNGIIPHELFEIQYYNGGVDFESFCLYGDLVLRFYGATFYPALECDFTVGTKELTFENELVKIYPNPVVNGRQVSIKMDQTFANCKSILTIYNSFGQELYSEEIPPSIEEQAIDISLLNPGIYYLQFSACNALNSSKLIVQ
jgi:hypothetical protein